MAQNTTRNDVENRLKDMFVRLMKDSQNIVEFSGNTRRISTARKAQSEGYYVDCEMRNELPPYPQYGGTISIMAETRADSSGNFEGDHDRSVVERMIGQVRELIGQTGIVSKINRYDRRIVIHADGLKEADCYSEDTGSIRRQVIDFEVHCYAP